MHTILISITYTFTVNKRTHECSIYARTLHIRITYTHAVHIRTHSSYIRAAVRSAQYVERTENMTFEQKMYPVSLHLYPSIVFHV
jgi:hypothetical protein